MATDSPPDFGSITNHNIGIKRAFVITSIILLSIILLNLLLSIPSKKCRLRLSKQTQQISGKFFLISFLSALISFYSSSIICIYILYNTEILTINDTWNIMLILSKVPYDIGRFVMEIYFIARLYFIFAKSEHSIKKFILIIMVVLASISCIMSIIGSVIGALGLVPYDSKRVHPPRLLSFLSGVIGMIVSATVIILFISILYKTNIDTMTTSNIYQSTGTDRDSGSVKQEGTAETETDLDLDSETNVDSKSKQIKLGRAQMRIIYMITKNSFLGVIGLTSSMILYGYVIMEWILHLEPDPMAFASFATLDGAINCVCMNLVFSWSTAIYDVLCCVCHYGVASCCVSCTEKSVKKQLSQDRVQ